MPAGTATTVRGNERGLAEFPEAQGQGADLIALSGVFGGLAVMVAIFVVASTLGLSLQLRKRELALLRAIGATPRQLRRMVFGEAVLVSLPATAVAYSPSTFLGEWLLGLFGESDLVAPGMLYEQSLIPTASAVGIGLLTAVGAALIAARGATRMRPAEHDWRHRTHQAGRRHRNSPQDRRGVHRRTRVRDCPRAGEAARPAHHERARRADPRPGRARHRTRKPGSQPRRCVRSPPRSLRIADRAEATADYANGQQISAWVTYLLVAMIVGYTVISLVNTLILATAERRREFALQRLIGATRGQVVRMMGVEAAFIAIAGTALGTAVAAATLIPSTSPSRIRRRPRARPRSTWQWSWRPPR